MNILNNAKIPVDFKVDINNELTKFLNFCKIPVDKHNQLKTIILKKEFSLSELTELYNNFILFLPKISIKNNKDILNQQSRIINSIKEQPLGKGAYGTTFQSTQTKNIYKSILIESNNPSLKVRTTFKQIIVETFVQFMLSNDPHFGHVIPKIESIYYFATNSDKFIYIKMEKIDALYVDYLESLYKIEAISLYTIRDYMLNLLSALYYFKKYYGFTHNDLHIGNIMINKSDLSQPKIIDFGFSCINVNGTVLTTLPVSDCTYNDMLLFLVSLYDTSNDMFDDDLIEFINNILVGTENNKTFYLLNVLYSNPKYINQKNKAHLVYFNRSLANSTIQYKLLEYPIFYNEIVDTTPILGPPTKRRRMNITPSTQPIKLIGQSVLAKLQGKGAGKHLQISSSPKHKMAIPSPISKISSRLSGLPPLPASSILPPPSASLSNPFSPLQQVPSVQPIQPIQPIQLQQLGYQTPPRRPQKQNNKTKGVFSGGKRRKSSKKTRRNI
jgi:hypothetical protein